MKLKEDEMLVITSGEVEDEQRVLFIDRWELEAYYNDWASLPHREDRRVAEGINPDNFAPARIGDFFMNDPEAEVHVIKIEGDYGFLTDILYISRLEE